MTFPKVHFTLCKRCVIALILFAAFNILVGQFTNIDLSIEDYYFDMHTHTFLWKNTWFAKDFMHGYLKDIITVIGRLLLLIVLLDLIYPWFKPRFYSWLMFKQRKNNQNLVNNRIIKPWWRVRLRFVAIASLVIPSVVAIIKYFSALHCPWDLARYGGFAPFVRLFDAMPTMIKAGQCFPAGHATVGLWLAALCVFWLPHKPKMAFLVFLLGLSIGFALGWVQQMRGAHFLFHTLWSVWLAALVIVVMLSFTKQLQSTNQLTNQAK